MGADHERAPGRGLRRWPDAVFDRDLALQRAPADRPLRRLRLDRRRRGSPVACLQIDGCGRELGDHIRGLWRRHRRGLLRWAVLLRQRDRGRSEQSEHRLRCRPVQLRHRVGRDLPLGRRRSDVEEPRLGSAPGLPRVRVRPHQHRPHPQRLRRRRLVQRQSWWPSERVGSAERR